METPPVSNVTLTQIEKATPRPRIDIVESKDQLSLSPAAVESQKIAGWVELIKEMPDTLPPFFERGESGEVNQVVSEKILKDIPSFLT